MKKKKVLWNIFSFIKIKMYLKEPIFFSTTKEAL